ncbi:MAG: hypothetical protein HY063_10540 [Bacteroidetes bacterium]|nr:hypothetical protein [Bacteroidota bacterium]
MNLINKTGVIFFLIGVILFTSCRKDKLLTDSSAKLEFSATSILFDTVFTTVGSVTKTFLVYNRHSQTIKISSIKLARGTASSFRINVDGMKGVSFSNIEIKAKDSLFVFAEVTVDPNNSSNPLIIRDSIVFETNGNMQDVDLEAWGQDAYFHTPNIFPADGFPGYSVIKCNDIWKNDKPHVIYAYAVVDSGCTLTLQPGTKVYMHPNAVLYVNKDATLKITGSQSQPVIFQGDRLESAYAEAAGQWGWIWLSPQSKSNKIDWAIIKNGYFGIMCDTVNNWSDTTLRISNSIVKNMSVAALYGRGTFMKAWNCVFANCGQYAGAFTIGGKYSFYHCTFANYWSATTRQFPVLLLNNYYKDVNDNIHARNLDSAFFYNCIVYGDLSSGDELKLDNNSGAAFNYKFHNCLLKTTFDVSNAALYQNVIVNKEPYFHNVSYNDYTIRNPLALDAIIGKADAAIANLFPYDLRGNSRIILSGSTPTTGAYEYVP